MCRDITLSPVLLQLAAVSRRVLDRCIVLGFLLDSRTRSVAPKLNIIQKMSAM